jgi:hypothetical protein
VAPPYISLIFDTCSDFSSSSFWLMQTASTQRTLGDSFRCFCEEFELTTPLRHFVCDRSPLGRPHAKAAPIRSLEHWHLSPSGLESFVKILYWFHTRFQVFRREVLHNKFNVVGDWYRYEWQGRGSSHCHGTYWSEGAPDPEDAQLSDAAREAFAKWWGIHIF